MSQPKREQKNQVAKAMLIKQTWPFSCLAKKRVSDRYRKEWDAG